jgi:hypothetical protein
MIHDFDVPNCCFIMELCETQTFVIISLAFSAETSVNLEEYPVTFPLLNRT